MSKLDDIEIDPSYISDRQGAGYYLSDEDITQIKDLFLELIGKDITINKLISSSTITFTDGRDPVALAISEYQRELRKKVEDL